MHLFSFETHLPHGRDDLALLGMSSHLPDWPVHDSDVLTVPPWLHDAPGTRAGLAKFNGQIEHLDGWVGKVIEAVDTTGLAENTVLIFTTDHGMAFPGAKGMLSEPGTRIALILRFPPAWGIDPQVVDSLTSNIDIVPTILRMIGVSPGPSIRGSSIWEPLAGGSWPQERSIFMEKNYHDRYDPKRAVRTERYKYVRNFVSGARLSVPKDVELSDAGRVLSLATLYDRDAEELYDLEHDPGERTNLASDGEYSEVANGLRSKLDAWMWETNDPLLTIEQGAVIPYPPGQWL
jgi:arylsulfatase A-like enzyme